MSNVEAAASLFGIDDSSSDPFASLGANADDISQEIPKATPFDTGAFPASGDDFFAQQGHEWDTTQNDTYNDHQTSPPNAYGGAPQQREWNGYTPSNANNTGNVSENDSLHNTGNGYSARSSSSSYNPYQPSHEQNAKQAPYSTMSTTKPYEPSQTTYQTQYSPDYAAPVQQTSSTTYGQPYYAAYSPSLSAYSAPVVSGQGNTTIPQPPPVISATVSRPKVSNAYDPPVIATRPTKRALRSGLTTPFANDPYSMYSQSPVTSPPPQAYNSQPQSYNSPPPQPGPPMNRNSYSTPPPPRNRTPGHSEYVPAYGLEYTTPPLPPSTKQSRPEVQSTGRAANEYHPSHASTTAPTAPPFRRPSSSQVAEHFGPSSRSNSRAASRTSSPLVNYVYSAPNNNEVFPKEELPAPPRKSSFTNGVGLGLQNDTRIVAEGDAQDESPTGDSDKPTSKDITSESQSSMTNGEADEAAEIAEKNSDMASPQLSQANSHIPFSENTAGASSILPSLPAYDVYSPKRTASPASSIAPPSSHPPSSNQTCPPPLRPMSAAALTTNPYAPNKPIRVTSPPIRSASAFPGASSSNKQTPTWSGIPPREAETNNKIINGSDSISPLDNVPVTPAQNTYQLSKPTDLRARSASSGSQLSNASSVDPYAPTYHRRRETAESFENGPYSYSQPLSAVQSFSGAHLGQELSVPATTRAQYAPSPSLSGTNDSLSRTSARAPVFTFGFGGKLITCFHGASLLNTGYDVALSSRKSTTLQIRSLQSILPDAVAETSLTSFPGPLFSDPSASLVRTGLSSQAKGKKAKVVKYLDDRATELSDGVTFLRSDPVAKSKAEGKLVLVYLLKIMVENEGRLSGSPETDIAVRNVLLGRAPGAAAEATDGVFTTAAELSSTTNGFYGQSASDGDTALAAPVLKPSILEKIQDFLLQGERRQAYHYALDQKLWAHAMVIASSIDKEAWNEATNEFIRAEIGSLPRSDHGGASSGNWEALRTAYSSYSGQGAASVSQMAPQNQLSRLAINTAAPKTSLPTPPTLPFSTSVALAKLPSETLSQWMSTVAMLYTNSITPELSATLTALGDQLAYNEWTAAAHVCYILSSQTSLIGGINNSATRIVLLGSQSPQVHPNFHTNPDSVILTEILEYAMSLATPVKGHEPFHGLPHLQSYKLAMAAAYAEKGDIKLAQRYCEAIATCSHRQSPYLGPEFLEQLKGLTDRIVAAPHVDKGSWIPGKMSKPSLDTIGGWLEGRITKLITGDGEGSTEPNVPKDENTFNGPFSHYGTISSSTSPQASATNLNVIPPSVPGPPTLITSAYPPISRASSATGYSRKQQNMVPQAVTAGPWTSTFAQSSSHEQTTNSYQDSNPYGLSRSSSESSHNLTTPTVREHHEDDANVQEVTWWGNNNYGENSETPTVTSFHKVDSGLPADTEGFVSLMDNVQPFTATPSPPISRLASNNTMDEDEDEDLGLSTKRKPKTQAHEETETKAQPKQEPDSSRPAAQPNPPKSASWLGRFFNRGESGGPVKASLGEETSFVYDKELKRWVNKKAGGSDEAPQAATPPPPRAQTASPSAGAPHSGLISTPGTPPVRPASLVNGSTPPPPIGKTIPRIRSNLVPPDSTSAPPTPAAGASLQLPRPPMDRPRSQASKKNIRSRYVDVFQASGAPGA